MNEVERKELTAAIEQVLEKDLANGGSTIDTYLNLYGKPGRNQESFYVYGRAGDPCQVCSNRIELIEIGGRRTHFCPNCQPKEQLALF